MDDLSAARIVKLLSMQPHPEGGHFVETFRDPTGASTAIYFLLEAGECSHWHRVLGSAEVWLYHAGGPLVLTLSPDGHDAQAHHLGPELAAGQSPQIVVPADCWQTAETLGHWTLVSCTVAPAFDFENFELAPPDWRPMPRRTSTDG